MQSLPVYTDFQSLAGLRSDAGGSEGERLVQVAEQFSAVFTHMMLKSMRQASLGEGIFDSQQSEFYRDMFDQQLALELSSSKNVGISNMLIGHLQQFTGIDDTEQADLRQPSNRLPETAAYEAVQRFSVSDEAQDRTDSADKPDSREDNWMGQNPR